MPLTMASIRSQENGRIVLGIGLLSLLTFINNGAMKGSLLLREGGSGGENMPSFTKKVDGTSDLSSWRYRRAPLLPDNPGRTFGPLSYRQ